MSLRDLLIEPVNTRSLKFQSWFCGSRVVDWAGRPDLVYHRTTRPEAISEFSPLDHFGTLKAATADQKTACVSADALLTPVFLSIKNPFRITDRRPQHTISDLARYLAFGTYNAKTRYSQAHNHKYGSISLSQFERIMHEGQSALIEIMFESGYDAFCYRNTVRDRGSSSWIVFTASQVCPMFSRGLLSI